MRIRTPRKANVITALLLSMSVAVLVITFAFNVNIVVIKDWSLVLPAGAIHEGDTITVQSVYTKVRAVNGVATRYIECQNAQAIYIRYPLSQAPADREPGKKTGTGIVVKILENIPSVPTTCRISINVTYPVYPWRRVTQFAVSKDFQLLPRATSSLSGSQPNQTNPSQELALNRGQSTGSLSNDSPSSATAQSDSLQDAASSVPTIAQPISESPTPSVIQRILGFPVTIIKHL